MVVIAVTVCTLPFEIGEAVADRLRQQDDVVAGGLDRIAGRSDDADDGLVGLGQRVDDRTRRPRER